MFHFIANMGSIKCEVPYTFSTIPARWVRREKAVRFSNQETYHLGLEATSFWLNVRNVFLTKSVSHIKKQIKIWEMHIQRVWDINAPKIILGAWCAAAQAWWVMGRVRCLWTVWEKMEKEKQSGWDAQHIWYISLTWFPKNNGASIYLFPGQDTYRSWCGTH